MPTNKLYYLIYNTIIILPLIQYYLVHNTIILKFYNTKII